MVRIGGEQCGRAARGSAAARTILTPPCDPQWFYVSMFTAEFVLRIATCPSLAEVTPQTCMSWRALAACVPCTHTLGWQFVCSGMNWIDFISIAPSYLELVMKDSGVDLRALRVLRCAYPPWPLRM